MKKCRRITAILLALVTLVAGGWAMEPENIYAAQTTKEFIARRGDTTSAPEDTVAALKNAYKRGYSGVEFDIWFTKAGEILVSYKESLKDVYGVNKKVVDVAKGTRSSYIAKTGANSTIAKSDLYLPSLASYLSYVKKYKMKSYIYVRNSSVTEKQLTKLKKIIDKYVSEDQVTLFSINSKPAKQLSQKFKHAGLIFGRNAQKKYGYKTIIDKTVKAGAKTLLLGYAGQSNFIRRGDVAYAHKKGLTVSVYQVNEKYDISRFYKIDIDSGILNTATLEQVRSQADAAPQKSDMAYIAHRGDVYVTPPDTIASFKRAKELGFQETELDIWFTKAGEILVSHEKSLKKIYGVNINVENVAKGTRKSYVAITEKDSGIAKADLYLPSLQSAAKYLSENGMKGYFHIKNATVTTAQLNYLYRVMEKYNVQDSMVFSGHNKVRKQLGAFGKFRYTGAVFTDTAYKNDLKQAAGYGLDFVIFCYRGAKTDVKTSDVTYGHGKGLDVLVYGKTRKVDVSQVYKTGLDGVVFNAKSAKKFSAVKN